jgi:hypothetical protein
MKRKLLLVGLFLMSLLAIGGCSFQTSTATTTQTTSLTTSTSTTTISTTTSTTISTTPYIEQLQANLSAWGLGTTLNLYYSLERPYSWYVNQFTTDPFGSVNCGPTSVEMAGLWTHPEFAHTAEEARTLYRSEGGWWYDSDISGALTTFGIDYEVSYLANRNDLIANLESGRIILINNNMSLIPYNSTSESRLNRFYTGVTGHYLLVIGYIVTDTGTYFEMYDPYNGSQTYLNGTPKGQNRYYEYGVLVESIVQWYSKIYAISAETSIPA